MNITTRSFNILGLEADCFLVGNVRQLTSQSSSELRASIKDLIKTNYSTIYLDVKDVYEMDLAGVNEIINMYYTLQQHHQNLVLIYRKGSVVDGWVNTTSLDRFVETAVVYHA